jgi:hypothetical protein
VTDESHLHLSLPLNEAGSWELSIWMYQCPQLSPPQLLDLFPFASVAYDQKDWKEKLALIFQFLPRDLSLETVGQTLSLEQFLEILTLVATSSKSLVTQQHLSSLLVGIPSPIFQNSLLYISKKQLSVLQQEAVAEPLQHHLFVLERTLSKEFLNCCQYFENLADFLKSGDLTKLNREAITNIYTSIENLEGRTNLILLVLNYGLALAWNSDRLELIENLGHLKERAQRFLLEEVGRKTSLERQSSGLWKRLEAKVDAIFNEVNNDDTQILMPNETPALEALSKFSLWYLQDYHEIGLLPDIELSEIKTLVAKNTKKNQQRRAELIAKIETKLSQLGLNTLEDIKEAKIFSKQLLIDYIKR